MTDSSSPASVPDSPAAISRLVARERVRAMESLAGTIAHEIRSAVLGVTSAAQLLRYALPPDPVAEKSLGRILQESERLSSLHKALSEYAIEVPPRFTMADPDDVWSRVIGGMRGALEANSVTMTHSASSPRATCSIDEDQLIRAFERIIHHMIGRAPTDSRLVVASSIEPDHYWVSALSTEGGSDHPTRSAAGDFERPTFLLVLANRTLVAHGGEVVDQTVTPSHPRMSIRLPLSIPTE